MVLSCTSRQQSQPGTSCSSVNNCSQMRKHLKNGLGRRSLVSTVTTTSNPLLIFNHINFSTDFRAQRQSDRSVHASFLLVGRRTPSSRSLLDGKCLSRLSVFDRIHQETNGMMMNAMKNENMNEDRSHEISKERTMKQSQFIQLKTFYAILVILKSCLRRLAVMHALMIISWSSVSHSMSCIKDKDLILMITIKANHVRLASGLIPIPATSDVPRVPLTCPSDVPRSSLFRMVLSLPADLHDDLIDLSPSLGPGWPPIYVLSPQEPRSSFLKIKNQVEQGG